MGVTIARSMTSSATSSTSSSSSSWGTFMKSILIPLLAAALLYTVIFIVAIPLYRRYKNDLARYSAYAPLDSELGRRTTSLFSPYIIQPGRSLFQKIKGAIRRKMWQLLVPGMAGMNLSAQDPAFGARRESWSEGDEEMQPASSPGVGGDHRTLSDDDEEEGEGLFDVETGQSMIGFDVRDDAGDGRGFRLGRNRVERQISRDERARRFAREMTGQIEPEALDSQRRLSRELEGAFGDESDEEEEGVVVGRNGRTGR